MLLLAVCGAHNLILRCHTEKELGKQNREEQHVLGSLVLPGPLFICFSEGLVRNHKTQPRHDLIGRGQCTEPSSQRPSTFNNLGWSKVKCGSVSS